MAAERAKEMDLFVKRLECIETRQADMDKMVFTGRFDREKLSNAKEQLDRQ